MEKFRVNNTQILKVHERSLCEGEYCVIHNPSPHHMRKWPLWWRSDRRIMERICPEGIGHPDPDDTAFHLRKDVNYNSLHGCDGCCSSKGMEDNGF